LICLVIFALRRGWGLIILGGILVIAGIYYGLGSHQVTYRSVGQETVTHFLSGDGSSSDQNGYLQLENDPNLYVLNESDFTPTLNGNSFGDSDVISFIYRPDTTTSYDVKATNTSTELQGNFYTIEQITVAGSNGQSPKVYTSSEYKQNPKGFYQNNWWPSSLNNWWQHIGGGMVVFGLIIVVLALVVSMLGGKSKAQPKQTYQQGGQQYPYQPQAYGQSYQYPNQYSQYPQQSYQNAPQYQQPQYPPQHGQYNLPPQYPQYPQQPGQQYPQQGDWYEPTQRADPPRK
jgi:hypothetical protein